MGEPLGVKIDELQELEWDEIAITFEEHVKQALAARQEKLLGKDGQITRDLEMALERLSAYDDQNKLRLLGLMSQGARTYFDSKTHKQMRQVFTRLQYVYLAGELLQNIETNELDEQIHEHLQNAQAVQRLAWGESERVRLGAAPGGGIEELGRNIQNQIYRQVLLGAITELWVDYLTSVEALRVSVGLEAYAQSDPLVKYKSQASEMFQTLLSDIRSAVIGRIYLYQPRGAAAQAENAADAGRQIEQTEKPGNAVAETKTQNPDKKRKRHRH